MHLFNFDIKQYVVVINYKYNASKAQMMSWYLLSMNMKKILFIKFY